MKIIKPNLTTGKWEWVIHDHSCATLLGDSKLENHVVSCSPCDNCMKEGESPFDRCTMPYGDNIKALQASKEALEALELMLQVFGKDYIFDSSEKGQAVGKAIEALEYGGYKIEI